MHSFSAEKYLSLAPRASDTIPRGRITKIKGQLLAAEIPHTALGDICIIKSRHNQEIRTQVISFNEQEVLLAPFDPIAGIMAGDVVENKANTLSITTPFSHSGQVLNAFGENLNETSPETKLPLKQIPLISKPVPALSRRQVAKQIVTGIHTIDTLYPIGFGQKLGLFAGAGIGKSSLLGMLARNSEADINIIALIGERGREVNDFLLDTLGESGRKKSILVVATSDEPPIRRKIAAYTAHVLATHYRSQGKNVLLLFDSLTRTARAIRDVALSAGEIPVRHGYPSTVYTELPSLIESAGNSSDEGSVTAIYTVLTNGDDDIDPLGEEVKSLLDGHLYLSSQLALRGIFPAIDPLRSVSRLCSQLQDPRLQTLRKNFLRIYARLIHEKELAILGGKQDPELELILKHENQIVGFMSQELQKVAPITQSIENLAKILNLIIKEK